MSKKRPGYRQATPEERERLNRTNRCWIVRDYGDGTSMNCPNPRQDGTATCAHHSAFDPNAAPDKAAEEEATC